MIITTVREFASIRPGSIVAAADGEKFTMTAFRLRAENGITGTMTKAEMFDAYGPWTLVAGVDRYGNHA